MQRKRFQWKSNKVCTNRIDCATDSGAEVCVYDLINCYSLCSPFSAQRKRQGQLLGKKMPLEALRPVEQQTKKKTRRPISIYSEIYRGHRMENSVCDLPELISVLFGFV